MSSFMLMERRKSLLLFWSRSLYSWSFFWWNSRSEARFTDKILKCQLNSLYSWSSLKLFFHLWVVLTLSSLTLLYLTSDMMLKTVFLEPSLYTFFEFVESQIHRGLITEIDLEINVLHLCQSSWRQDRFIDQTHAGAFLYPTHGSEYVC